MLKTPCLKPAAALRAHQQHQAAPRRRPGLQGVCGAVARQRAPPRPAHLQRRHHVPPGAPGDRRRLRAAVPGWAWQLGGAWRAQPWHGVWGRRPRLKARSGLLCPAPKRRPTVPTRPLPPAPSEQLPEPLCAGQRPRAAPPAPAAAASGRRARRGGRCGGRCGAPAARADAFFHDALWRRPVRPVRRALLPPPALALVPGASRCRCPPPLLPRGGRAAGAQPTAPTRAHSLHPCCCVQAYCNSKLCTLLAAKQLDRLLAQ